MINRTYSNWRLDVLLLNSYKNYKLVHCRGKCSTATSTRMYLHVRPEVSQQLDYVSVWVSMVLGLSAASVMVTLLAGLHGWLGRIQWPVFSSSWNPIRASKVIQSTRARNGHHTRPLSISPKVYQNWLVSSAQTSPIVCESLDPLGIHIHCVHPCMNYCNFGKHTF